MRELPPFLEVSHCKKDEYMRVVDCVQTQLILSNGVGERGCCDGGVRVILFLLFFDDTSRFAALWGPKGTGWCYSFFSLQPTQKHGHEEEDFVTFTVY